MDMRREITKRAERQHGLVTRANLRDLDVTRHRRAGLVDRGVLVPVHANVFRIAGAPSTPRQRILAVCLDRGAVASHRTGAWLHGLSGFPPPGLVEVTGGRPSVDADVPGAIVHTTPWLPPIDVVEVDGIPTLAVARLVLSLCALVPHQLSRHQVATAVNEACRDGLASDPWLWWRLERLRRSGLNGVRVMESLLAGRGEGQITESWLEEATLAVLRDAELPLPRCQARIERSGAFVARVDFLYDDARLVIEVAGHRPHKTKIQSQRDAERHRALALQGYVVLPFTYDDVVRRPAHLVAQVVQGLGRSLAA